VIACASYTLRDIQYYSRRDDLRMIGYSAVHTESENAANESREIARIPSVAASASSLPSSSPSLSVAPTLVAADLRRVIKGHPRVWLFLSRTYHGDPNGDLRRLCDEHFSSDLRFQGAGVEVIRYEQR